MSSRPRDARQNHHSLVALAFAPQSCNGAPGGSVSPRFLPAQDWESVSRLLGLSKRQCSITAGLLDGMHEADIAKSLEISVHTVHTYVSRLYRRLGVRSRAEVVVRVFEAYVACCGGSASAPLSEGEGLQLEARPNATRGWSNGL